MSSSQQNPTGASRSIAESGTRPATACVDALDTALLATGGSAGAVWLRPPQGGAQQLHAHADLGNERRDTLTELDSATARGTADSGWDPTGWLGEVGPSRTVAAVTLPTDASGEPIGTIAVWGPEPPVAHEDSGAWGTRALQCLSPIARQLARVLSGRIEADSYGLRLQASIGSLVGAETVQDVADVVLEHGVAATSAARGVFYQVDEHGTMLDAATELPATGDAGPSAAPRQRLAVSQPLPPTDVVRTGRPIFIGTGEELARRYPAFLQVDAGEGATAVASLPLKVHGRSFGTLLFTFAAARHFHVDERAFLVALAQQCELALERVRLSAEARVAREAKSDFLAVMSHELRTPLNAILGHAELVVDGIVGPVSDLQRMHLTRLQRSGRELLGLVEEVLTLTTVEAGADIAPAELIDIGALAREAVVSLEPAAVARGVRLRALIDAAPDLIETHVEKARHIVLHLVSNAIKFTEQGEVTIALFSDADGIECEVRDTGIGIASQNLEHIFEPFWQVERPHTRRSGGMGLGLHITRRFARILGGDVVVSSRVGMGSTFTLRLPRRYTGRTAISESVQPTRVVHDARVRDERTRSDPPRNGQPHEWADHPPERGDGDRPTSEPGSVNRPTLRPRAPPPLPS